MVLQQRKESKNSIYSTDQSRIGVYLFLTLLQPSGLRRRGTNALIRLSIWIAYLGADTVAVYALGCLSRQEEGAHSLAFFWAPFLLIHLGGQDTITAFAMEDNNLWLRHLLNLVVQVVLAVYVFWKSIGRHSMTLLVSGALVFVVGVIKYGERTWSLRCARFESLEESPGYQYELSQAQMMFAAAMEDEERTHDYCGTFLDAIHQMTKVFSIFVSRESVMFKESLSLHLSLLVDHAQRIKSLEICLGLMYDDLYTKALGLRTLRGILFRCISQVCALVAFIVFVACVRRSRYGRVDTAITYSLFIGCLLLELCGLVRLMASPWTWLWTRAWKKSLKLHIKIDKFSWFLLSSDLTGWSQKRPLWSNAIGQYNLYGWVKGSDEQEKHKQPWYSFSQQCMAVVRRLATLLGLGKEKIFFTSKLLDTEHVKVDGLLQCLVDSVDRFVIESRNPRELPNLGAIFRDPRFFDIGFGSTILSMHLLTEQLLCKSAQHADLEANTAAAYTSNTNLLMEECRKLSRYVIYLVVACPSLLPLEESPVALLEECQRNQGQMFLWGRVSDANPLEELVRPLRLDKETLEEIKEVWIRLIIHAASKSRPEQHAALLATGGELLTFVWLQLRLNLFGRSDRIELTNKPSICTLHLPTLRLIAFLGLSDCPSSCSWAND